MAKKNKLSMVQSWMPQDAVLIEYYEGIAKFVHRNLPIDVDSERSSKIIHDPLTGDVYLEPWEIAIVDTKLFQRTRDIKQVGLAYLIFPSLTHSRFEHCIGVLGRLEQLLVNIASNTQKFGSKNKIKDKIDEYRISIRLAALMHDVGHCIFSHASERVINNLSGDTTYPSSKQIREIFTAHFEKSSLIPFAEIFTISLLGSADFYDFFKKVMPHNFKKNDLSKYLEVTARFVLGLPVKEDSETIFLAQLISSGLDADKIDYMTREAHYAGISLGIDLDRIYSKVQVFELKISNLPLGLKRFTKLYNSDSSFWVLGFQKGGQYAFEEFCIARLSLYVKIYLHQKVRAAETQLSKYLEMVGNNQKFTKAHEWLYLRESIIEIEEKEPDLFNIHATIDLSQIKLWKIKNRLLYQRAFAFGHINSLTENSSTLNEENIGAPTENKSIALFKLLKDNSQEYVDLIYNEYLKLCDLLEIAHRNISNEILIDIPKQSNIQQGHDSLYFSRPAIMPLRWTIPINRIIFYYQLNKALAYIFCPSDLCPLIYLASEKVIFIKTKSVFLPDGVISNSILVQVSSYKEDLIELGYYEDAPDLKPKSVYLLSAEAAEKIHTVVATLSKFRSQNDEVISIDKVTTFLNQFPTELQDAALDFLSRIELYDERILIEHLKRIIEGVKKNTNKIGVSPLGGIVDSAAHLMYSLREVFSESKVKFDILDDDLVMKNDHLIIFDDNINSGLQLINIIAEWLEKKDELPKQYVLSEKHVNPLRTDDAKNKLRSAISITFVYTIGFDGVESIIKQDLFKLFDINPDNIDIQIHTKFSADDKIFSGKNSNFQHAKKNQLRDFLKEVAGELLLNEGKPAEKIKTRLLGYADAEAMAIFPYNVPTMTVTALWLKGKFRNSTWYPLSERRRRTEDGNLVGEDS